MRNALIYYIGAECCNDESHSKPRCSSTVKELLYRRSRSSRPIKRLAH